MWTNLATLFRYRGLIRSLVARDLKARYRGSVLGFFWSFINPLMLLSIYSFVFDRLLPNMHEGTRPYEIFMFCGLLPWTWFSSSVLEGSGALISGGNLIKKVLFPAEILPIAAVLSNMVHFALGLTILAGFMVWRWHFPDWNELAWFPFVVAVQFVFTMGFVLLTSALTVHFRDLRDLLSNLLTFWFFFTPIIYSYQMDTVKEFLGLFNWNPFFHFVVSYQEILFFHGPFGHLQWMVGVAAASVAFFFFGYWVFDRLRDSFAEAV